MPNQELQLVIPQTGKDAHSYCKSNASYVKKLDKTPITEDGKPKGKHVLDIVLLDIARCVLDPTYQLETRQARDAGLKKNWDMRKCEPIMVNFRDNKYLSVMNGVHRIRAAYERGIPVLPAYLYTGLTKEEEVTLFVGQGTTDVKVQPKEKFLALVAAGDPTAVYMQNLFQKYNFEIRLDGRTRSSYYNIQGLSAILEEKNVLLEDDKWKDWLNWMFGIFNYCNWGDIRGCTEKYNIEALAAVYKKNNNLKKLSKATENLLSVMYTYGPQHLKVVADMAFQHKDHSACSRRKNLFLSIADGTYTLDTITIEFEDKFSEMGLDKYLPDHSGKNDSED